MTKQTVLPRWRGFNLLGMFAAPSSSKYAEKGLNGRFDEDDFRMISEFGFNFVRLPLSYKVWADESDPFKIIEEKIAPLDDAVEYGKKYGLHVNICLHRIPGYCINDDDTEPFCLWTDPEALECAKHHWRHIAKRYKDIPCEELSFNLFNEPKYDVDQATVTTVYAELIKAIREIDPDRLIIADGTHNGNQPPTELMSEDFENIAYSCRGYNPGSVTHFGVSFMENSEAIKPVWPGGIQTVSGRNVKWDRAKLDRHYGMWAALAENFGVGVICGEMGCFYKCPHDVMLAWYKDMMESLKERNIGYAVWNFRGTFGIMDSGRDDIELEDYNGHKLDRELLTLLQKY